MDKKQFSRRALLKTVAGLGLTLPALLPVQAQSMSADVVVIGAGVAGLAAARFLRREGYTVMVLEGRNRMGGRVWTSNELSVPLDLGATWIHGVQNNPLTKWVKDGKLETLPANYDNRTLYGSDGKVNDNADAIKKRLAELMRKITTFAQTRRDKKQNDVRLSEAISAVLGTTRNTKQQNDELAYEISTAIEHEYAADVSWLSALNWNYGETFGGGDAVLPKGYAQIPQQLAQGLDVRLNQVIKRVSYANNPISLETDSGQIFSAKRVIVTVPLGVLKANQIEFRPALPPDKRDAIQQLGMGILNKTVLRFPRAFWDVKTDVLGFVSERKGEWNEWLNWHKYTRDPILVGFNAGEYGREIESLKDADVVNAAMQTLRKIYGSGVPAPNGVLQTRWGKDRFALGAYSFVAPGTGADDHAELGAPVNNKLFFAGEATSVEYPATVHGALLSGEREAKRIVDLD